MGFSLPSPPLSEGSGLAELQEWLTDTERPDLVADLDTHNALPAPAETLPQRRPNDRSTSRVLHDGSSIIINPGNADNRANNYNINDSPEAMTAPLEPEFQVGRRKPRSAQLTRDQRLRASSPCAPWATPTCASSPYVACSTRASSGLLRPSAARAAAGSSPSPSCRKSRPS
ncbi:hypothetical protein VTO42DRAFT_3422 [Malbranchea cinnamomea]